MILFKCFPEPSHSRRESTEAEGGSTFKAASWLGVGLWVCGCVAHVGVGGCRWVLRWWGRSRSQSRAFLSRGSLSPFLSSTYTLRLGAMTPLGVVGTKSQFLAYHRHCGCVDNVVVVWHWPWREPDMPPLPGFASCFTIGISCVVLWTN